MELVRLYTSDYSSGPYGGSSYPDYADYRDLGAIASTRSCPVSITRDQRRSV